MTAQQNQWFDALTAMRQKWVDANRANGFENGLKNLLTDLYPDKNFCHGDLDALASDRSRRGTVMGVRTGEPENRVLMDGNVRTHDTSQFVRADNSKTGQMRQTQLDIAETDFARRIADLGAASARADILTTPVVFGQIHITRQAPNP